MKDQKSCLFCKIISREIPCAKVYENNEFICFLDIKPIHPGHTLIVPKQHYTTLLDLPLFLAESLLRTLQTVGTGVLQATNAQGFNLLQNNYQAAGQLVFHAHFHLIPRFDDDALTDWSGSAYPDDGNMNTMAHLISKTIGTAVKRPKQ